MNSKKIHIAFGLMVLVLAIYLGLKTLPEDGWSGWGECSAQTLLSTEYWAKDGIIHSKALFIPMGYSKQASYFDEPELSHHARGTVYGGLIGRKVYYTHYPSGYLLPFALIRKAGFTERHWFRLYSLSLSLVALVLMYAFFNKISTQAIALASATYYAVSLMFLDYADSLANQPLDDMLRFAILALSISAVRSPCKNSPASKHNLLLLALYFILSISSYDSTFFVFIWLLGLDLVMLERKGSIIDTLKGIPFKKWALFASAPVLAFCIQILQNWWYLGFDDMLLDFKGIFIERSSDAVVKQSSLLAHIGSMLKPLYLLTDIKLELAIPLLAALAIIFLLAKKGPENRWLTASLIGVLFAAGAVFPFVFSGAKFSYVGKQFAPAISLLIGSATVMAYSSFFRNDGSKKRLFYGIVLLPLLAYTWYAQISRTATYVRDWPNHAIKQDTINFYKDIGALTDDDSVVFIISSRYQEQYPQPSPIYEFYSGKLYLLFMDMDDMVRDYLWLKKRSERPFDAIMVFSDYYFMEEFKARVPLDNAEQRQIGNRYVLLIKPR